MNWASKSACASMSPTSSFMRSGGALSPNKLKLFKKSMNILNSAPVTSSKLYNGMQPHFISHTELLIQTPECKSTIATKELRLLF